MGATSSRESDIKEQRELKLNAYRNYHARIKAYNYAFHGPYYEYLEWCQAQFQLDCIPEMCRKGCNYTPQYDARGRQIY